MPTQGEEVVIKPYLGNVQHVLPDQRQLLLQGGLRGTVGLCRAFVRHRQGTQIELANSVSGMPGNAMKRLGSM